MLIVNDNGKVIDIVQNSGVVFQMSMVNGIEISGIYQYGIFFIFGNLVINMLLENGGNLLVLVGIEVCDFMVGKGGVM